MRAKNTEHFAVRQNRLTLHKCRKNQAGAAQARSSERLLLRPRCKRPQMKKAAQGRLFIVRIEAAISCPRRQAR
jgi:hypothetical protein